MIPGIMVKFLARASVGVAATRDAHLVPQLHLVSGWSIADDGETMTCLIGRGFVPGLLSNLEHNRHLAITLEVIGTHECYQFKGEYQGARDVVPADLALWEACRERFVADIRRLHGDRFPAGKLEEQARGPELAVRLLVREIFIQTPGPAAGARLFPREDS